MQIRAVIEQAQGVPMRDRRCTPDEAFRLLVRASDVSNRKLHDVALSLVEGAQRRPGGGRTPRRTTPMPKASSA
jgi:AmiR/NasT family two-component response regulator